MLSASGFNAEISFARSSSLRCRSVRVVGLFCALSCQYATRSLSILVVALHHREAAANPAKAPKVNAITTARLATFQIGHSYRCSLNNAQFAI
jgi:hypothetical protein